ncbi:hypothetical protein [Nocardia miyunensis]|uniref:WXG100-like domain-containing protein n=1 Tax=Nocardia miyunensis TaxID=282684 RepID=UPI0008374554|nr:hypothetical protein [Nocardia miyunensis]
MAGGGIDKPSGLDYLLDMLGLHWPDGDEYKMWDLADAWHDAAKSLDDIDADIDAAIAAVRAAYPDGTGGDAMIEQLQSMRTGSQSIDQLVSWFNHVGDSAQSTGDSIEGGKINFETLLLTTAAMLLADEGWGPFAPAAQAGTIAIARVGAWAAMRQLLKDIVEAGLRDVLITTMKSQWQRLVMHLVLDATLPALVDLGNQEARVLSGHQDGIHWGDVGKTAVVGLAGGLTGGLAGGLMQGWMRNLSSGMFKGLASGITGGVAGTLASGLTDMAYTGKWELNPSALVAGAFWGAHGSLGGHHTVEDGSAPHTRVNLTDEGGAPRERVSIPTDGQDGSSPHVEPAGEHSPSSVEENSGTGQHGGDDSTRPSESERGSESSETQDHSTSTHDRPVDSQSTHDTSSESGSKVHSTGSDEARPESHSAESHPAQSHNAESRSEGTNVTAAGDHSGARSDNAARPESPVSARSGGSTGDGVRAPGSSARPSATGDGSSAYRPSRSETAPTRDESTSTPAERPMAGSGESSGTRPTSDPPTAESVSADKPFSASLDQPVSEAPRADDVPVSASRPVDDVEFTVPDDISGIHETPAPPEPSTRAGLADDAARPGVPERPSSRTGDRPESSSPIRARSTGAERAPRAGESASRAGESSTRPAESSPRAGDSSRTDRAGSSGHPRELVGARARGDDDAPRPEHPGDDDGTRPPDHPGEDPHVRAGLPENPRPGDEGTHPAERTPEEHRTGDHDEPATRPADHEREEPQRDSTDQEHHEDGSPHPDETGPHERPSVEDAFRDHAEPTDAGLSLHAQDPELSRLAGRVPADDRYFTVDAHVTADGHVRIGEHRYTPEEFGDMLRQHGWDGEKPIRMIGCDAAENGFANRLANHLDTDVLAPTEKAWSDEHGRVYTSTSVKDDNGNPRPRIPPDGEWHTTHPDGTRTPASEDGFVPGTPESAKHGLDHDAAVKRGPEPSESESEFDRGLLLPDTGKRVVLGDATYVVDELNRTEVAVAKMELPENYKKRGVSHLDHPVGWIGGVDHRGHLIPEAGVKNHKDVNVSENIIAQHGNSNVSAKKIWENACNKFVAENPGIYARAEILDRDGAGRVNYTEFKLYDADGEEIREFSVVLDNPALKGEEGRAYPLHSNYLSR